MKNYIRYAKNLSTYFGASLIPMVLNLIANPWIAKNMSPVDYAISGYYTSFSTLISPIITFYMVHYYIKEYFRIEVEQREKLYATIAKATIWFSGVIALICFIALLIYFKYFNSTLEFPISPYLALMVFALPLTGLLNLQLARYRMEKQATGYFRLSVCNGILNIGFTLLFVAWLKWGAFGKLLGPMLCNTIVFIIMIILFRKHLNIATSFDDFKRVFRFCLPLAFGATFSYFLNGFTTSYLETIGDSTEYGYYVVGASIGGYLMIFGQAIGDTFLPDLNETTVKKQWRRYVRFCLIVLGLTGFVTIVFVLFTPVIINLLTAGRYVASTIYARIIAFSTITARMFYLINNYTITTNKPKLFLTTSILGSILVVLLVPIIVERWQFIGGACMSVCTFVIFGLVNLLLIAMNRIGIIS